MANILFAGVVACLIFHQFFVFARPTYCAWRAVVEVPRWTLTKVHGTVLYASLGVCIDHPDERREFVDIDGKRVSKVVTGGASTTYVYDAQGHLAAEYSTRTNPDSGTQYLTSDPLGSTRLITTGTTTARPVKRLQIT